MVSQYKNNIDKHRQRIPSRARALKTAIKTVLDGLVFTCFMAVMILILEIIGA